MNIFDRFIDSFSMKDLAKRVNSVILFGFAVIIVAIAGGYYFLNTTFLSSIDGVVAEQGALMEENSDVIIKLSIDHDDIGKLPADGKLKIDINSIIPGQKMQNVHIKSIDPAKAVVEIAFTEERISVPVKKGAEIKLILTNIPLWKLIFKK